MPKFLLGCLVALVVVAVGGGTAGYFLLVKPAYQFVSDVGNFTNEFTELNEEVPRDPEFRPPSDGQVEQDQFERFLAVQRDMRRGLDERLPQLQERLQELERDIEERDGQANPVELIAASRELAGLLLDGKRYQVDALNAHQFSLEEYLYVRNQTFQAIGQSVAVAGLGEQGRPDRRQPVPEEVVDMVEPHQEELMQSYALVWFGL